MFKNALSILVTILIFSACHHTNTADLSGEWKFKLDSANIGLDNKWYTHDLNGSVQLPGSLPEQNIGYKPDLNTQWTGSIYDSSWYYNPAMAKFRDIEEPKFPFWLTPDYYYTGAAWYQKEIEIPEKWSKKEIRIFLERPHWQTDVWIDTIYLGHQNSLSVPHVFSLEPNTLEAGIHRLSIRVDNAIRELDPGINSHSISDHTQSNWNGIVGNLQIQAVSPVNISLVRLTPDVKASKLTVALTVPEFEKLKNANISLKAVGLNLDQMIPEKVIDIDPENSVITLSYDMGENVQTWSEFSPNLYSLTLKLSDASGLLDQKNITFGMREFGINGKRFVINGVPTFLRGTTECALFPKTGYPPTTEEEWDRIFKICSANGLNHMRFHSWCPPEAAFIAADKAGIYLQVEGPSWAKYSTSLGYGKPIDKYLMDETKGIIDAYGNHPSFCMMAYGNEPSGRYVGYLENWVDHFRTYDPQRVFTGASTGRSWAIIENSDFIVRSPPRGLNWKNKQPESMFDYRNNTEGQERPYVTFEMGQWCVFPDFNEIDEYNGPLKARNFELFKELLADNHMADQAHDFLMASGKLQASCYKQEIEATLRTPNLAGFQLLSLNDFSGQGTALVGVLNAFWEEKDYISADEFSQFTNRVVPLVRLPKYTFTNTEHLNFDIEVANFSGSDLENADITWQLKNEDEELVKSETFNTKVKQGNAYTYKNVSLKLDFVANAQKLTLEVAVDSFKNYWNIWVYPKAKKALPNGDIYISNTLDKKAIKILKEDGKVLILASGKVENGKDVVQYYTPAFWNTSWFRMRPPHTTGILIKNDHPVFNNFPTDYYSDLQWWDLINRQQVMNMENFPPAFRPIVQPIDTWFLNRRLGMLIEARIGNGKLMVCSADLTGNIDDRPAAKQLYNGILNYMTSDTFNPADEVKAETIAELFEVKEREGWKSYVKENP